MIITKKRAALLPSVLLITGLLFLITSIVIADRTEDIFEKWVARYDYTDPGLGDVEYAFNIAWDLVVDDHGNVFTAGYEDFWDEDVDGKRQRWVVVKYDSKGDELWVRKYEDPGGGWAQLRNINADGSGGVYASSRHHIIRYGSDGTLIWEKDVADIGIEKITGLRGWGAHPETDSDGNYIFALSIATDRVPAPEDPDRLLPGVYDICLLKFRRSDGEVTHLARYSGPGKLDDEAYGLFIDENDDIFVTGYTVREKTGRDLLILKYDKEGNLVWKATYNNELINGDDLGNCIAVESREGDVYITGMSARYRSYSRGTDAVTLKYSKKGEFLWKAKYRSPDAWRTTSGNLALDSQGDVYISGYFFKNRTTRLNVYSAKYDSDNGDELWVKTYESPATEEPPEGKGLLVDEFDNVYFLTLFKEAFYLKKLDPSGNMLWETGYNPPDSPMDRPFAMTMDHIGNVYVCGTECQLNPDNPELGPQPDVAVTIKYAQPGYAPDEDH